MRFVIYGAGGVGCAIGGQLHRSGHEVLLVARGSHLEALRSRGLTLRVPGDEYHLAIPTVGHPRDVDWRPGDVVILAMKTQDTTEALRQLELAAGTAIPVVCAQNGVENERLALRRFENVYAMLVALPASFTEPGVVVASGGPLSGVLHTGRYPYGADDTLFAFTAALSASNFLAEPDPDVLRLKRRKLLLNLHNALEIITGEYAWGAEGPMGEIAAKLRAEGARCFEAAGLPFVSEEEYAARVTRHYRSLPVGGESRSGSSSLQSVIRGHETVETDYFNGEIELLGRLHGIPTPYNSAVRRMAVRCAALRIPPGTFSYPDVDAEAARPVSFRR